MNRISEGAEATIYRDNGTVRKERHEKPYRHPALDKRLRTERTDQEARLLKKAYQAGVRVPTVESVEDTTISMERIDGPVLKQILEDRLELCELIGESIARLHNKNIVHGDLTTSNMILHDEARSESGASGSTRPEGSVRDDEVYFIDFGLGYYSQRYEDYAVDLHLLYEVLESTHTAVADDAMEQILAAYRNHAENAEPVLERYEEIAERGRYT